MIIVIDGYNLLKQLYPANVTDEKERDWLLKKLHVYGRRKGHSMIIVFDGGDSSRPIKEYYKDVLVVFSGFKDSADEYIAQLAYQKKGKELLLVSSDRQLRDEVGKAGMYSIGSLDFYPYLQAGSAKKQVGFLPNNSLIMKTSESRHQLVDDIMMQSVGVPYYKEVEVADESVEDKPKKLIRKKDRLMFNILKKL